MSGPVHLAHHWWVWPRGGGKVFEEMAALFPEAEVSMIVHAPETLTPAMARRRIHSSPLQRISPHPVDHRWLLPFYPWAVRRLGAPEGTRLLLTSDASVIKGLRKPPGCVQVCYCHSPPRYLWDMAEDYARHTGGLRGPGRRIFRIAAERVRRFDREAADNVDHFVANSHFVAERIRRFYGREAAVLHPPVEVARFRPAAAGPGDYYLLVSELVSYKRADLAAAACARLGRRLVVVGDGPEAKRLRRNFAGAVEFRGRRPDAEVAELMAGCRAFLHPQLEDFGITAVEAQAAGRPVVAYRGGGALETVAEGETGLFFDEQTPEALASALTQLESRREPFSAAACRRQAERFAPEIFRAELRRLLAGFAPDVVAGG